MTGSTYGGSAWSGESDYQDGETYASLDEVQATLQVEPGDLGLNDSEEDDDGLTEWDRFCQRLQRKAKRQIDAYCQRDFEPYSSQVLTLDGGDGSTRVLSLPKPVREVHWIEVDGSRLDEGSYTWKRSGPLIRQGGDTATARTSQYGSGLHSSITGSSKPTWPAGYGNIEVLVDYGYLDPPQPVKEAEAMLVDHSIMGQLQKRASPIVQSDDYTIEANIPVALTDEVKEMLRQFKPTGVGN